MSNSNNKKITLKLNKNNKNKTLKNYNNSINLSEYKFVSQECTYIISYLNKFTNEFNDKFNKITDQFNDKFNKITDQFNDKFNKITDQFNDKFNKITDEINGIKDDIIGIKDDIVGIHKYMKMESDFQEKRNRLFITKLYLHNHPTHNVTPINITKFFDKTGKEITDFDGFILLSSSPIRNYGPSQELINRLPDSSVLDYLKNNYTDSNPFIQYILIESKHSLSKGKVDKKIKQLIDIWNVFSTIDNSLDDIKINKKYKLMVTQIYNESGLKRLNYPIHLIFSSDDISYELLMYIIAIYNGIDNIELYDSIITPLFYSDKYIMDTIHNIILDTTIPKNIKYIFNTQQPINVIRDIFKEACLSKYIKYVKDYLVPFSELNHVFSQVKGRIGVSQFNTVNFPILFKINSLNHTQ